MWYIEKFYSNSNSIDRSADLNTALRRKREAFAADVARHEFGSRNYPAEGHDGFVDRSPGEIAILRAARCQGAAR